MIRIGLAIIVFVSAFAAPGFAQDRPDSADGRYTLHRTDEGYPAARWPLRAGVAVPEAVRRLGVPGRAG